MQEDYLQLIILSFLSDSSFVHRDQLVRASVDNASFRE